VKKKERTNRIKAGNARRKRDAIRARQELATRAAFERSQANLDFWSDIAYRVFEHVMRQRAMRVQEELAPLDAPLVTESIQ